MNTQQTTEHRFNNIEHRLESIEQEHFALWEIVQAVAKSDAISTHNNSECVFCHSMSYSPLNFNHAPSCIVLKARALVAQNNQQSH